MLDSITLFHILISFGAFQAIFLAVIFLSRAKVYLAKRFFAFFLIIEGVTLIERVMAETGIMQQFPHLLGISYPISFIKAPTLFLMAIAIVNPKFKLRRIHTLHLIPFIIILLMNIPFYVQPAAEKLRIVAEFITYVPTYRSFDFWLFTSFFLHIGIYILLSIRTLKQYQTHIKNNRQVNWYLNVLQLYAGFLIISFIHFAIQPSGIIEIPIINTISMLAMTFLIQSIAYSFLSKENILNQSTIRANLDMANITEHYDLLLNKLNSEKIYIKESLSLEDLAKSMELPKKYVSDLINQKFGKSFKMLINEYRVNEAKQMMERDSGSKTHLIDIGLESGFNNKVSFYRAFKQHTGKSPSEYFSKIKESHSKL